MWVDSRKSLRLLAHEMNRDIQNTFSLYKKLSTENIQFKYRMFQWLRKGLEIRSEREKMMDLIRTEFRFLVVSRDQS